MECWHVVVVVDDDVVRFIISVREDASPVVD